MTSAAPAPSEQTEKEELLFALHHRDKPTLAFVECKTNAKRDELAAWLQQELTEYQFYTLDVTPLTVTSLLRTLDESLPAAVKNSPPVTYVVNVYGLENRLDEHLAAQLNLERELLFRSVPYLTLIWADAYFFRKLQRLAPDLWHWVTYKFRFDDPTMQHVAQLPPLPPERLEQKGDIEARRARIQELEERYSRLDLRDSNKVRLLRDKLVIKILLAQEYTEAFEYPKAIAAYRYALGLEEQLELTVETGVEEMPNRHLRSSLLFGLGWAHYENQQFEEALVAYSASRLLAPESEYGNNYHQIGMVYAAQGQWAAALESYGQALAWEQKMGNDQGIGRTYHEMGMVYADQHQWMAALESYKQAIEWYERTGDNSTQSSTYHQVGMVYAAQRQWEPALKNYDRAIGWRQQTGDTFEQCNTYHQRGVAHEAQGQWADALENYNQAIAWSIQTGNVFALGNTYHQVGRVHEKNNRLAEAVDWSEKAVASMTTTNHPNLPIAQASLARVQAKLRERPA